MDFNDIKSKLERTLSSLNARFDEDYKKHTNIKFIDTNDGSGISLTFGKDDKYTVDNKILIILHNLAALKDGLKECLKSKGLSGQIIEDEVKNSLHLLVLLDLNNAYKHKYPTDSNKSGKNPQIKNVAQVLGMGGTKKGDVTEINIANDGNLIVHGVPPKITINADICDDQGNILFDINTLVNTCFSKWDAIARQYNCVS